MYQGPDGIEPLGNDPDSRQHPRLKATSQAQGNISVLGTVFNCLSMIQVIQIATKTTTEHTQTPRSTTNTTHHLRNLAHCRAQPENSETTNDANMHAQRTFIARYISRTRFATFLQRI